MSNPELPQLPVGFRVAGHACGIKSDPTRLDLALFASDRPCAAAGVFTQNRVVGAPVQVSRERLPSAEIRGVVINSGNANACTGERGLEDARAMTAAVAGQLECNARSILVCSTGVIGHFLPMEKITAGLPEACKRLADSGEEFERSGRAMMTTDTFPKLIGGQIELEGGRIALSGVCKGAAMIAPNMATMLAVMMTDAVLSPEQAQQMVSRAVDRSFNSISVDGHTSTSDTVFLLANGASGVTVSDETAFQAALDDACRELAQMIIRDAEGAEHFVTIDVTGLPDDRQAHRIAKVVAESMLVKTAITGNDPNWGRIVSAAGYAGLPFDEADVTLAINGTTIYEHGVPLEYPEETVSQSMARGEVHIDLTIGTGPGKSRFWTSDLTSEYVRLNSEYTT
ncbi:Arginine biosynthesis bifunctional protein ArgJ [Maioricimonas rarisocia]|uniref:Arginine biosynthesis bifunctional protein ArgJ n=1 Tax=Maioricimonas rarisocia TaxID=2528026 RepID=A0A517ZA40_9PLAN|nr:bifunctional glutamate N-acetyltransferase/amino-acid acetyltransferase ArgJ [Maioricimonas rarisocia]QDU39357.1 Arginine biosynthesis bifunctional protein ArgJ [Maioricimonas rarisocia]